MPVVNFLQTQSKDTVRTTKIRNGAIEIFRFFLIFTVIWKHAIDSSPDPILFPIGVVGFFFLSGFFQVNS